MNIFVSQMMSSSCKTDAAVYLTTKLYSINLTLELNELWFRPCMQLTNLLRLYTSALSERGRS